MPQIFQKDADAVLDYTVDWEDWLEDIADTISASDWIVASGITEDSDSNTTTTATVWLSGGVEGSSYRVTNRITTVGGRTQDASIFIEIVQR